MPALTQVARFEWTGDLVLALIEAKGQGMRPCQICQLPSFAGRYERPPREGFMGGKGRLKGSYGAWRNRVDTGQIRDKLKSIRKQLGSSKKKKKRQLPEVRNRQQRGQALALCCLSAAASSDSARRSLPVPDCTGGG